MLTEKQKLFADEYLIDLNATRAYKVAYPRIKNDETAYSASSRMLRNVKVKSYIDERMKEKEEDAPLKLKRVHPFKYSHLFLARP